MELELRRWTILNRRGVVRLVIDTELAPLLREEKRLSIEAACPSGHRLVITATREVVRALEESPDQIVTCPRCVDSYSLALGEWPSEFVPA